MNKTDLLWLRACKLSNSDKRLKRMKSIYRRFYLNAAKEDEAMVYILQILSNVMDRNNIIIFNVYEVVCDNHPSNWWKCGSGPFDSYPLRMVKLISSKVALLPVSRIPGWVQPAWIRNMDMYKDAEA